MADDHQRRRRDGEHLDPHIGIAEIEQRDRTAQRRRAGRHGHVFSDEQHRKKDRHRNQGHAPVNKPDGRKAGDERLAALEAVPNRKAVSEHAEQTGKLCAELPHIVIHYAHINRRQKHRQRGFENVDQHDRPSRRVESVDALEVGEAGVVAARLANVLVIHQPRHNDRTVNAAEEVGNHGDNQQADTHDHTAKRSMLLP